MSRTKGRTVRVTTQWFLPNCRVRVKPRLSNRASVPLCRKDADTRVPSVSCGKLSTVPPPSRAISRRAPSSAAEATPVRRRARCTKKQVIRQSAGAGGPAA
ncbi:hypothetical protein ABT187_16295 [Streptomyces sp. NPDC001817]|uniref:hypothetical protein n=1 Tax=Streptomyces sp. NPDC001817 TaxID=3154398 RepID=UPI00331CDFB2